MPQFRLFVFVILTTVSITVRHHNLQDNDNECMSSPKKRKDESMNYLFVNGSFIHELTCVQSSTPWLVPFPFLSSPPSWKWIEKFQFCEDLKWIEKFPFCGYVKANLA